MNVPLGVVDVTTYARSTMLARNSRMKHIQKLGENPTIHAVRTYFQQLNISSRYKQSILKLLAKQSTVDYSSIQFKDIKRLHTPTGDIVCLKNLLYESLKFLADLMVYQQNTAQIYTRGKLESVVAMAIAYCTGLRTNEIQSLKICDLYFLKVGRPIQIRIKKKNNLKVVHILSVYHDMYPYILYALAESYDTVEAATAGQVPRFQTPKEREKFLAQPQDSSLRTLTALTTCTTTLNAEIRIAYLQYNNKPPEAPIGLKSIRKLTTTELIVHGRTEIAQHFNRHVGSKTTENHYLLPTTSSAFDQLGNKDISMETEETNEE